MGYSSGYSASASWNYGKPNSPAMDCWGSMINAGDTALCQNIWTPRSRPGSSSTLPGPSHIGFPLGRVLEVERALEGAREAVHSSPGYRRRLSGGRISARRIDRVSGLPCTQTTQKPQGTASSNSLRYEHALRGCVGKLIAEGHVSLDRSWVVCVYRKKDALREGE